MTRFLNKNVTDSLTLTIAVGHDQIFIKEMYRPSGMREWDAGRESVRSNYFNILLESGNHLSAVDEIRLNRISSSHKL